MKQFDFANFSPLTIVGSLFSVLGWRNKVVQFFNENAIFVLIQSLNLNINLFQKWKLKLWNEMWQEWDIENTTEKATDMWHRKYPHGLNWQIP